MGLNKKEFVVTHAAVSSRNGIVKFPDGEAGQEAYSITHCDQSPSIRNPFCVDVNMYSLDSYVEKFVKSRGPINMLSIDAEGWDFDVLFGGSTTLDRTYYLEFEYHRRGVFRFFCLRCLFVVHNLLTIIIVNRKLGKL
jgi:FkbM family methyltransferase